MPATSKNVLSNSFKGFENLFTQWRMFAKMTFIIISALLLLQIFILSYLFKNNPDIFFEGFSSKDLCVFRTYTVVNLRYKIIPITTNFNLTYTCDGSQSDVDFQRFQKIFKSYYDNNLMPVFKKNLYRILFITGQIYWLYFILIYYLNKKHQKSIKDSFLRGKVIINEEDFSRLLIPYNSRFKIHLNEKIFIPDKIMTKHNFIIGATGSGKSQLANRIIEQLIMSNYRCIIHDFKGDMIPSFYNPEKHYIFNPLDVRHMGLTDKNSESPKGWTVFNELETIPNVDAFASSMIPDGQGDPIWYTAPRDLLKAMIYFCIKHKMLKNEDLFSLIETPPDQLRKYFDNTPGCKIGSKHLEEGKLAGQFMSILATYTASLQYVVGTDGDFSIRKWIADTNSEKRIIFLSNQAEVQKTLKTLISTFFDFSTKALCSLPDDPDSRRLHLVFDEFGQLSKMDSVVQLLTQGRSKGACAWLFIQDMGQIEHLYGKDLSKTIINGCRSKYYFNVADNPTAEFISKEIGTVEFQRTRESKSFGVSDLKDSISINDEIVERPIALASQITSQKNLSFYLQLSDIPQITHTSIKYRKFPVYCEAYQPRDIRVITYGENQCTQNASPIIQNLPERNKDVSNFESADIELFKEIQQLPLESEEVPVDQMDIPDMNLLGVKLIPESEWSDKLTENLKPKENTDFKERINF